VSLVGLDIPPSRHGQHVFAVDIGGTKVAVAVIGDTGEVVGRVEAPTSNVGAEELFNTVTALLDRASESANAKRIRPEAAGIGCGGPLSEEGGTVSPLHIPQWQEFPLRDRVAEYLGIPTFLDNDAKALALGEGWLGAAQGARDYMAMVVSTGIGAGIVLGGELLQGSSGNAGHLGHIVVAPDGPWCACGVQGCLEAVASGTAIRSITGHPAEKAPLEVRIESGKYVGRAVATVVNLLDLQLVLVAGSVALGFGEPFFSAANTELLLGCGLEYTNPAKILPGGLGSKGPLVGAAAVAWRGLG